MDSQYIYIILPRLIFIVMVIFAGVTFAPISFATVNGIVILGELNTIPNCVENVIKEIYPHQQIISAQNFKDSLFPFFEPSTAPKTIPDLSLLLEKPAVRDRVNSLEVRYVITIAANTSYGGKVSIPVQCVPNAGCYGYVSSSESTELAAIIWDLENPENSQTTNATASGENAMIALVLPLPIFADTEGQACKEIAQHIVAFLKDGE